MTPRLSDPRYSRPSATTLTIFCGSRPGHDPAHAALAEHVARALVNHGVRIVFGAGGLGLMGVVAKSALEAGGEVVGVIPHFLADVEPPQEGLTELHFVDSMHQRKAMMADLADGFLILPGGIGTLDEAFEIISWRQLGLHDKPIVVIEAGGYWSALREMIGHVVARGFAGDDTQQFVNFVPDADAALAAFGLAVPQRRLG